MGFSADEMFGGFVCMCVCVCAFLVLIVRRRSRCHHPHRRRAIRAEISTFFIKFIK